jgi:transcriptional regulator with XRE-family HTH domain
MRTIFKGMRARREELGLSIYALAEKIGVSPSLIQQIESDVQRGSLSTRIRIANALDLPMRYMVSGTEAGEFMGILRANTDVDPAKVADILGAARNAKAAK